MATVPARDGRNGGPDLPVSIFLRPMGSPLPLGLAGLAIASLLSTGVDFSWVPLQQTSQMGFLLLVTVVPIQLLACAFAFPARDGATASTIGILAATWAAYGITKLTTSPFHTSHALGLVLLMAAGVLAGGALAQGTGKILPALVIGLAAARFALNGIYELTASQGWQNAAGAVGLAVAAGAVYLVWALSFEDERDRTTLPTLRRGRGKIAVEARASRQLVGVEHEPGVRTQL
jgi:succinate-acetate transporter protein